MCKVGRKQQYFIDIDFLNTPSNDLYYILGFTMADGFITEKQKTIQYTISQNDIEILEFIQSKLCPNRPIRYTKSIKNNKVSNLVNLKLSAYDCYDIFGTYNIIPKKTGYENLPTIPDKFKFDYLRGFIDGDGCIYLDKNKNIQIHMVCSNVHFLEQLQDNICNKRGRISKKGNNSYQYRICRQEDVFDIYEKLYQDNPFGLSRKKLKFTQGKHFQNLIKDHN